MYEVETIQIDEDNRVTVYVDEDCEDPRNWGWEVEMHDIDGYRIWRGWDHPGDPIAFAAYVAQYNYRKGYWTETQRDRAISIFKAFAGDTRQFQIHEFHGHMQSDWATVLEIGEELGLYETYAQWRRGDVYILCHEKREQWTNQDETREMDTWEEHDTICGVFVDGFSFEAVARENFDLPPKEDTNNE